MQKLIIHFAEDRDQKNVYNLIAKMIDVLTNQLKFYRDDLQSKGFEIFIIEHKSIEAKFIGKYIKVADMIRELDKED